MSRIQTPDSIATSPSASRPLLDAVKQQLGSVPNLFRMIGNSPSALHVALNTLTNYVNSVAHTDVDFPAAPAQSAA